MPEILKTNGNMDYSKVFMAFAAALVLVLQQYQGYRIAVIQAEAKAQEKNYMSKDEIYSHLKNLEDNFIPKGELMSRFELINKRIDDLEQAKPKTKTN